MALFAVFFAARWSGLVACSFLRHLIAKRCFPVSNPATLPHHSISSPAKLNPAPSVIPLSFSRYFPLFYGKNAPAHRSEMVNLFDAKSCRTQGGFWLWPS
jgi:hypothetical protein